MKGNEQVLEYLNKALKHELTAVSQYWLHYRMLDDWGFAKLARKSKEEALEEMQHADSLIERILFLEGFPNLQNLNALMIGQNLEEVLSSDLKAEYSARALYQEARGVCNAQNDYASMNLFESLIRDEEGHIDWLETQIDLLKKIGIENYGQLQADAAAE